MSEEKVPYGKIHNTEELGQLIRHFRQSKSITQERVSGIANVSTRLLSEVERGKETAEIGKVLTILDRLGLEVVVRPRGTDYE